jgi:hypothetical protein
MALCCHEGYPYYEFCASAAASPRVCTGRRAPCMGSAENQARVRPRRLPGQSTQECRQTHFRGNTCPAGVLPTVAASPAAAGRRTLAVHGVAMSCGHRCADDVPDAVPLTGRLQQLGAHRHVRIHPGALPLAQSPRAIPPPIVRHDFRRRFGRRGWGASIFVIFSVCSWDMYM